MLALLLLGGVASAGIDVEAVVAAELDRALSAWRSDGEVPHHVAVTVEDRDTVQLAAREGALAVRDAGTSRHLDVDLRLGTPALDSARARFKGVWPPNWTITPSGWTRSQILSTSSVVSGSKNKRSDVS